MFSFEIHSDDSIFVRHKMDCMMTYIRKCWKSIVKSEDESREIILDSQRLAKSPQDPYETRMIHIHCRYVKWWFVWFSGSGDISGLLTGHTCTPHVHSSWIISLKWVHAHSEHISFLKFYSPGNRAIDDSFSGFAALFTLRSSSSQLIAQRVGN